MSRYRAVVLTVILSALITALFRSCGGYTEVTSEGIARDFVEKSPTFIFDGLADTLALTNIAKTGEAAWTFTYEFQSRHGGYGDRAGQSLTEVTTPHQAVITVEKNEITRATLDGKWNMLTQSMIVNKENSRQAAETFMKNSPTFKFDGIEDSLELMETLYPDIENAWQFVFQFESRHAGYGDRTGEALPQVITSHEAIITVENGEVTTAIMDGKWDMIEQKMLSNQ